MAYFSNGAEGDRYLEQYCQHCINWRDKDGFGDDGCPVWDAHLNYQSASGIEEGMQLILDLLIPMKRGGVYADECSMFYAKKGTP